MSGAFRTIQVAVSDAQERGGLEITFGNHWHEMIPKVLRVKEIVLREQVAWGEQGSGKHRSGRGEGASKADRNRKGGRRKCHKTQRSRHFQEEN